MKKLMIAFVAIAGLVLFTSTSAEAGHGHHGKHFGTYGNTYGNYYGGYGCYNTYRPIVHRQWHDTSHWDYHPGGYVPHGNHYDYVPGHWNYHQTGHWDTHVHH